MLVLRMLCKPVALDK